MGRFAFILLAIAAIPPAAERARPQAKPAKQLPPRVVELLKSNPDQFIKRLDKNMDGVLTRNELPPFLAKNFEKWDLNGDGKLNRDEVGQMLNAVRGFLGVDNPAA